MDTLFFTLTHQRTWQMRSCEVHWPVQMANYDWMEEDWIKVFKDKKYNYYSRQKQHGNADFYEKFCSVPPFSSWWRLSRLYLILYLIFIYYKFCTSPFNGNTCKNSNVVPAFFIYSCLTCGTRTAHPTPSHLVAAFFIFGTLTSSDVNLKWRTTEIALKFLSHVSTSNNIELYSSIVNQYVKLHWGASTLSRLWRNAMWQVLLEF